MISMLLYTGKLQLEKVGLNKHKPVITKVKCGILYFFDAQNA
jgi:hypothetical protein